MKITRLLNQEFYSCYTDSQFLYCLYKGSKDGTENLLNIIESVFIY